MNSSHPKKYKGDVKFQELLSHMGSIFDVCTLRALISGYVWGLDFVPPSKVMEDIPFEGCEHSALPLTDRDQILFVESFIGLWNEFATTETKKVRKIRPLPKDLSDDWDVFRNLTHLYNDIAAFLEAMEKSRTMELLGDYQVRHELYQLGEASRGIEKILDKIQDKDELTSSQNRDLVNCLCVSRYRWAETYHLVAAALKDARKEMKISKTPITLDAVPPNSPKLKKTGLRLVTNPVSIS